MDSYLNAFSPAIKTRMRCSGHFLAQGQWDAQLPKKADGDGARDLSACDLFLLAEKECSTNLGGPISAQSPLPSRHSWSDHSTIFVVVSGGTILVVVGGVVSLSYT
ncbi:unnamed protein product [Polarella glacialis]|uniref:Uncharacterized protein n=1 Tax=Polarella glacialis TaxID=89957 RepID=A0A813IE66_POLGL|nr:unnamed protein product [Polarella glacialis]